MKRGRINDSGPSFSDLPRDITINFLLRLSIKRIFVCKIVCKTWHGLISEPEFAKLHFDQAQACPLVQISGYTERSRMLYLVQPEEEHFNMCDYGECKSKCNDGLVHFQVDTKFDLQFCDPRTIFGDKNGGSQNTIDHIYRVANSCNGMLCMAKYRSCNDPLVVCNPLIGEFVNLPNSKKFDAHGGIASCGFGFSPTSNQYKVIRMYLHRTTDVERANCLRSKCYSTKAEIHTLGTRIWKEIDFPAKRICIPCPDYLNGFLYWLCIASSCVLSFDIENERFRSISLPKTEEPIMEESVGVLGGELSISGFLYSGEFGVWVMKDKAWSQVFSIQWDRIKRRNFFPCQPVKYLNDGALLMFNSSKNCLIYMHQITHRIRYFQFRGTSTGVQVTAHIPSFVSLKDALSGHDVQVLKKRFTELKLRNEGTSISVLELLELPPCH